MSDDPSSSTRRETPSRRRLLGTFAAVALCFLGASASALYASNAIDALARDIVSNAVPSVERLSTARSDAHALATSAAAQLDDNGAASRTVCATERIARLRRELDAAIVAYLALPHYDGESSMALQVARDVTALEGRVDRARMSVIKGRPRAEVTDNVAAIHAALDEMDAAISGAVEVNARQAQHDAARIAAVRTASVHLTIALNAASVTLATLAALLATRAVRRYEATLTAQRQLAERRAAELDMFAGRVAHDIKSPLTSVGLALQLAERHHPDDPALAPVLTRGRASLRRVVGVIDDLLAFARAGARPATHARAVVSDVLAGVVDDAERAAETAGVALVVEPYEPCAAACSAGVLASLVSNLLANAIKYVAGRPQARVVVRVRPRRDVVRFEVEDTGPGVPRELQSEIFEPFARAPGLTQPGIGLGLATVRRLSLAHGGDCGVLSDGASGSTFWFELPRARAGR